MRIEARITGTRLDGRFTSRGKEITANILKAENESAQAIKARAVTLSQGTVSTQQQQQIAKTINNGRGLYSKRAPVALTPYIVNAQTGVFMRHWQTRLSWSDEGTRISLFNTASYAKYLFAGTSNAIARPISLKTAELEQPARLRRLQVAVRQALK